LAQACFEQVLGVARCWQAKSLDLRAATSLSRLWQQQGEVDRACHLLTKVDSWFIAPALSRGTVKISSKRAAFFDLVMMRWSM
jgi:hypothetical protein